MNRLQLQAVQSVKNLVFNIASSYTEAPSERELSRSD